MLSYVFTKNKPSDKACPPTFRNAAYVSPSSPVNATSNTTAGIIGNSLSIERVQAAVILSVVLPILLLTTILIEFLSRRKPVDEEGERRSGNRTPSLFRLTLHPEAVANAAYNVQSDL